MNWKFWQRGKHLTLVSETKARDLWGNECVQLEWRCASTGGTFKDLDYGNRFNLTTWFICPICGGGFDGQQKDQPWVGESLLHNLTRDNEEGGLTKQARKTLMKGSCPDCGSKDFALGPSAGMSQNIACTKCGNRFNIAPPFFYERIS